MIAPLRDEESPSVATPSRPLRRARRIVATALLPESDSVDGGPARIPAWQAWLLVGWMAATAAAYLAWVVGGWW